MYSDRRSFLAECHNFLFVSSAIYNSLFLYSEQPLLPYSPPMHDFNIQVLIEGKEDEFFMQLLGKKQSYVLSSIVRGMFKETEAEINRRLILFFQIVCMGSLNTDVFTSLTWNEYNHQEHCLLGTANFLPLTPSSSFIPSKESFMTKDSSLIKCANPVISTALNLFMNVLYSKRKGNYASVHMLYALTEYCRVCPPLRKWCVTEGLPTLGM
jgi:hypothetical protein